MSSENAAEQALIERARARDGAAFEEIVRLHQRRVYGVARRIVRRHDEADDVTQEAFWKAWQALDGFDSSRPFAPWVCRIARNLAIQKVRSPRWREQELPAIETEPGRSSESPLAAVLESEASQALARALEDLPPEQRAVFLLRTESQMSYDEIAASLQVPPGTVMSRLARARAKLTSTLASFLRPRAEETVR